MRVCAIASRTAPNRDRDRGDDHGGYPGADPRDGRERDLYGLPCRELTKERAARQGGFAPRSGSTAGSGDFVIRRLKQRLRFTLLPTAHAGQAQGQSHAGENQDTNDNRVHRFSPTSSFCEILLLFGRLKSEIRCIWRR